MTDYTRRIVVEVKTSAEVTDADVRHLLWLGEQLGATLMDMVVVTTGKYAYRRQDGQHRLLRPMFVAIRGALVRRKPL